MTRTARFLLWCLLPALCSAYPKGAPSGKHYCAMERPKHHRAQYQPADTNPYKFELVELEDDADGASYALRLSSDSGETFKGILIQPSFNVDWIGLDRKHYKKRASCMHHEMYYPTSVTHSSKSRKPANVDFKFSIPEHDLNELDGLAVRVIVLKNFSTFWEVKDAAAQSALGI